jgi:Flp pilus assembly pilin Flp
MPIHTGSSPDGISQKANLESYTMTALIKNFAKSESGAVTVDWVVLTAAMVGLGFATIILVSNGVEGLSENINTALIDTVPAGSPFVANGAAALEND